MKCLLAVCFGLMIFSSSISQESFILYSPDSSLQLEVRAKEKLTYVLYAGKNILQTNNGIDLELLNGPKLSNNLSVKKRKYSNTSEIVAVPVPYRRKNIDNQYNQLALTFKQPFSIEFRLFNNGMAYRIGTGFRDSILIKNETVDFSFEAPPQIWYPHIEKQNDRDIFHTSFEGQYKKIALHLLPDTLITYAPVVVSLNNGYHLGITDANLYEYPGMFLKQNNGNLSGVFAPYPAKEKMTEGEFPQLIVEQRANYIARIKGTRMLPWRVVMVAKNDIDLPANDLVYLLSDPSKIKDASWVKTGKGTDEWINGISLFNVPFVAGINTDTYKFYIDFAKKFGFNQIMLDAGWSNYKDLFDINPNINMDTLSDYAKKNNVRLMLWTLCSTLDKQLDSALQQFNKWGVQSIMTDFMDRDDQKMVNFYHRIAEACANHKITVMFHGAFPPKGFNRTWPNVVTHEGVLGAEWNIWSDLATPEHNVAIAFTRMLAGPLDYEPGLLLNAQKDQFRSIAKNPMSMGTRCHQLAMFAVYDSPLQIFSGNPSQGVKEPAFMNLLGSIPTTWDDTKILQGKIGEYIITARKKDNDWFIAGMNNEAPREITLTLDMIENKNYSATICRDGLNAHSYGSDYTIVEQTVKHNEQLKINMAPGGGFLIRLSRQ
ncbi:MAG: glycoside hydrolase family 97 protein [Chitinophagaceae bacterium]|nr:glycoside hydrolase family 97 protein [Chitinophagaceae bacterium]